MTKADLLSQGETLMRKFCTLNDIPPPPVHLHGDWPFKVCGYYRPDTGINLNVRKCAAIGLAGRAWSFPGYIVDRTPYGVIQHELGHHVDHMKGTIKGPYWSNYSSNLREQSGEDKITSYCPNHAEWFAEMFRVFVTNPDLLARVRPRTHALIARDWKPVFQNIDWEQRLQQMNAPQRTIDAAERRVETAGKQRGFNFGGNRHGE